MNDTPPTSLSARIFDFFHAEEVPFGLAIIRIVLPLVLLIPMVQRAPHVREMYSADGATTQLSVGYGFGEMLPELSGSMAVALHTVLLLSLLCVAFGWLTRPFLAIALTLYVYFNMLDAVSTMTKYSVIASHVLLILLVSRCGTVWSVDSWLADRRRKSTWPGQARFAWPVAPAWPRRLVQLLIGIVYLGAAATKMHTPAFFTGDQVALWMLTEVNYNHPWGQFLSQHVPLIAAMGYITLVWEVLFIFRAWSGIGRTVMLGLGIVFHAMTYLSLGLVIFPMIYFAIYASYINEQDIRRLSAVWRRWQRRSQGALRSLRLPSLADHREMLGKALPIATAALLVIVPAGAVGLEHARDPYGLRRAEGRYVLQPLPSDQAARMLSSDTTLRDEDRLFYFDIGTTLVGGVVFDRSKTFTDDETIIAQCTMTLPHEDLWIECELVDEADRTVLRSARVAPRELLRINFTFNLKDTVSPGRYAVRVKGSGREFARQTIEITASGRSSL